MPIESSGELTLAVFRYRRPSPSGCWKRISRVSQSCRTGIRLVICPGLRRSTGRRTRAGGLSAKAGSIGRAAHDAGLDFAWHNHDFEFVALPDGSLPMRHILTAAPDTAGMDVAWASAAGSGTGSPSSASASSRSSEGHRSRGRGRRGRWRYRPRHGRLEGVDQVFQAERRRATSSWARQRPISRFCKAPIKTVTRYKEKRWRRGSALA